MGEYRFLSIVKNKSIKTQIVHQNVRKNLVKFNKGSGESND